MWLRTRIFGGLLAVSTLLGAAQADAKCMSEWYTVLNDDAPIATNGRVVLEAGKMGAPALADFDKRHPVLRSAKDVVPLRIVERRVGELRIEQVLLEPTRTLLPAHEYRLDFDGRRSHDDLPVKTASGADTTAPKLTSAPTLRNADRQKFGCGPAVNAHITVAATDDSSHVVAHVELVRVSDGHAVRGFVEIKEGEIAVGHGMCGGLFQLEAGEKYDAFVTVLDSAGNSAGAPAKPVRFTAA